MSPAAGSRGTRRTPSARWARSGATRSPRPHRARHRHRAVLPAALNVLVQSGRAAAGNLPTPATSRCTWRPASNAAARRSWRARCADPPWRKSISSVTTPWPSCARDPAWGSAREALDEPRRRTRWSCGRRTPRRRTSSVSPTRRAKPGVDLVKLDPTGCPPARDPRLRAPRGADRGPAAGRGGDRHRATRSASTSRTARRRSRPPSCWARPTPSSAGRSSTLGPTAAGRRASPSSSSRAVSGLCPSRSAVWPACTADAGLAGPGGATVLAVFGGASPPVCSGAWTAVAGHLSAIQPKV